MKQFRRENDELINMLIKQYTAYMRKVAFEYSKSLTDVDDIVQDSIIKLSNHVDKFKGKINSIECKMYVNNTVRSVAIDYERKRKRHGGSDIMVGDKDHMDNIIIQYKDNDSMFKENPERIFFDNYGETTIYNIARSLPKKYADVALLRFDGYSNIEISKKLRISSNNVAVIYNRALKMINDRLKLQRR